MGETQHKVRGYLQKHDKRNMRKYGLNDMAGSAGHNIYTAAGPETSSGWVILPHVYLASLFKPLPWPSQ